MNPNNLKPGDTILIEEAWEDEHGHYADEWATITRIGKDGALVVKVFGNKEYKNTLISAWINKGQLYAKDYKPDHTMRFFGWSPDRDLNPQYEGIPDIEKMGVLVTHLNKQGEECASAINFDIPAARQVLGEDERHYWKVESEDPLTVSPSLLCMRCGDHGFIRNGQWGMTITASRKNGFINLIGKRWWFAITWQGNYVLRSTLPKSILNAMPKFWSFKKPRSYTLNLWHLRFELGKKINGQV